MEVDRMEPAAALLTDAFDRVREEVHAAADGLTPAELEHRVDPQANSIAWLVWHLTRIQDDHIADLAEVAQVWTTGGWHERLGLPFAAADTGFGHSIADVAAVRVASADRLTEYHDAVHAQTTDYLARLASSELERIIDDSWDPPVSLGVRLVSVIGDNHQHAGQAAFVRGVVERRGQIGMS